MCVALLMKVEVLTVYLLCSGDLRGNEQQLWSKIDSIQKSAGAAKNAGMRDAVDAAEKIRTWVSTLCCGALGRRKGFLRGSF